MQYNPPPRLKLNILLGLSMLSKFLSCLVHHIIGPGFWCQDPASPSVPIVENWQWRSMGVVTCHPRDPKVVYHPLTLKAGQASRSFKQICHVLGKAPGEIQ